MRFLKEPEVKVRDNVIVEEDEELPMMMRDIDTNIRLRTMIIEHNDTLYRVTIRQGYDNFGEIFDLKNDPLENNNLWYDKDLKDLRFSLLNKLMHEILNLQSRYPEKEALT